LRRKPDVSDELKAIREEEAGDDTAGGTSFKFLLGVFMILVSSLSTSVLTTFMSNKTTSFATDQDRMLLNCTVLQLVGAFISFFFIDKLDHKSILFGTLIPVALCVGILGFNEQQPFLVGDNASLYINMIGLVLYFFLGLGTTSVLWTACVGMFTTKGRAVTTTFLFALYFAAPSGYITLRAYQQSTNREFFYLYALAGCCMVTMVLLLGAGTKNNGVVCTKHEMETERSRLRRMRSNRRSLRTPGSARSRNLSRTRTKSTVSRNYQAFESPVRHRRQRNVA
jgi:callose synthase